jgi:hypothetical protein
MDPIDQAVYPNFAEYVREFVPKLISVPQVVKNLERYGNLTYLEAGDALTWGMGPRIVIKDLHHGQCGVPQAYGCFRSGTPDSIEIHRGTVEDYELTQKTDVNRRGKPVYVVGATLIHELCHWGNHNNAPTVPELHEMGEAFEKATYGKIIY